MKKSVVVGALFACLFASSVGASQKGYVCEVTDRGNGFIQSPVVFVFDLEKTQVLINDPIIYHLNEKPVAGDLKVQADGRYRVRWRVRNVPTIQDNVDVAYTAFF